MTTIIQMIKDLECFMDYPQLEHLKLQHNNEHYFTIKIYRDDISYKTCVWSICFNWTIKYVPINRGCCGRDRMVVGFTISAYHHLCCEFEPHSSEVYLIQHYEIKLCQWLAASQWFSLVSSTNTTDLHDITEILLKVALKTIILTL